IQYIADDQYLLIGKTETQSSLSPDSPQWQVLLEGISSFHFLGKNGRFTARREKGKQGGYYWHAYRKYHNKMSKHYIGMSTKLTPLHLEQVAAALQIKIMQASSRRGEEEASSKH